MSMLTVVIPAYNEEKGITAIINRVLSIKEDLKAVNVDRLELLVVNDGSRDRTCEIAQGIARQDPDLRVIDLGRNRGYGAALKVGFSQACGDLVGFLDADGTYPPEYFPALCKAALGGSDLVIGSRMAGAESKMPLTRRIGNLFFAGLLTVLGFQRVTDSASGMRVFKKSVLEKIYPLPNGLNFTPAMSTRAMHENITMTEVPIPYEERVGRSKLSVFRDGRIFLECILWTTLTYNPVKLLGLLGGAGLLVTLAIGLGLVITRLSGVTSLGPWGVLALYVAPLAGVMGIGLVGLGAAFNYLVLLFYKTPIQQGIVRKGLMRNVFEKHFIRIGVIPIAAGVIIAAVALGLGLHGWTIDRIWLYLLGSALMILAGMQLLMNGYLVRVMLELSRRAEITEEDLHPTV